MGLEVKVDLPTRTERRYIVSNPERFIDRISLHTKRKRFSDNEYIQTIYFNNEEHEVPFGFSIKARKYLPRPSECPVLSNGIFFLDLKSGERDQRQKIRSEVTLEEATRRVNQIYPFSIPVRPYILVEYGRQHFVPKNSENTRVTIDTNPVYFFFHEGEQKAVEIGRESGYTRVEIKAQDMNTNFVNLLMSVLQEPHAFPVISKKHTAYNFLGIHITKVFGTPFHKELESCEIESKLETDSEEIIHRAKSLFRGEGNFGFRLPSHFSYTFETASINRYYRRDGYVFKAMFRGDKVKIVNKGKMEVIEDPFSLNCIVKRAEVKDMFVSLDSGLISSSQLGGELYRMRKAFWIENPKSKRFYHISLDRCVGLHGVLHEMEVEYTGRYGENRGGIVEEEITTDIAIITKALIDNLPRLKPSLLTKQSWLNVE